MTFDVSRQSRRVLTGGGCNEAFAWLSEFELPGPILADHAGPLLAFNGRSPFLWPDPCRATRPSGLRSYRHDCSIRVVICFFVERGHDPVGLGVAGLVLVHVLLHENRIGALRGDLLLRLGRRPDAGPGDLA